MKVFYRGEREVLVCDDLSAHWSRRQRRTLSAHTPTALAISAFEMPSSNDTTGDLAEVAEGVVGALT
ncbi:hypothetical protein [Streptomyces sp. NPDC004250]|uniref:hypothetical protein n=1 Tax=Streptomyces sp. NPDC004250 TaxID=3364692 RepID=UPI0036906E47